MRQFINRSILFLILFLFLYPILLLLWGLTGANHFKSNMLPESRMDGHMRTRIAELKQKDNIEVLILGSSHAFRGIDTRLFEEEGISSFNLGSSSQTPIQTEILLKRYLEQINPKIVLYEVYPFLFGSDGVESALNIIATEKNDFYTRKMAFRINNLKVYNNLLFYTLLDFMPIDFTYKEPIYIKGDTYISGGYVERDIDFFTPSPHLLSSITIKYSDKQIEAFENILLTLREKNIKVVLIFSPLTKHFYESFNDIESFDIRMCNYGEYYNFNETIELSDSLHFYDEEHLNQYGVKIYTKHLIQTLNKNSILSSIKF